MNLHEILIEFYRHSRNVQPEDLHEFIAEFMYDLVEALKAHGQIIPIPDNDDSEEEYMPEITDEDVRRDMDDEGYIRYGWNQQKFDA